MLKQSFISNRFQQLSTLGKAFQASIVSFKRVLLVNDNKTQQKHALKVFSNLSLQKDQLLSLYHNEKNVLRKLQGIDGVVVMNQLCSNESSPDQSPRRLLLEHVEFGDLFQLIKVKAFAENLAKFYFRQINEVVSKIHQLGIVHRDLKLENILIDKNFNLKIIDFGFATFTVDRNGKKILLSDHMGTEHYAAPEILESKPYSGIEADIFSLGVILFTMVTGISPFLKANQDDPLYGLLLKNQTSKFWQIHEKNKKLSPSLKDLINKLLRKNPSERISTEEISTHAWLQQNEIISGVEIEFEIMNRIQQSDSVQLPKRCSYRIEQSAGFTPQAVKIY